LIVCHVFYTINLMKRFFVVALIIAAVLAAAYYFLLSRENNNVLKFSLPDYFPKEMIQDPYIVNLEVVSDISKFENEEHRAQITYISHKNMAENEKNFKNYFNQNEFKIEQEGSTIDQNFIVAMKDKIVATVSFWKTSPAKISIIYIILN